MSFSSSHRFGPQDGHGLAQRGQGLAGGTIPAPMVMVILMVMVLLKPKVLVVVLVVVVVITTGAKTSTTPLPLHAPPSPPCVVGWLKNGN